MKNSTRFIAALLAVLTSAGIISCGESAVSGDDTTAPGADTTPAETVEQGYDYPDVDYGGYEFRILNFDEFYTCYIRVDITEQTGETVDDAVYMRNRKVEEKLNFKMVEVLEDHTGWADNKNLIQKLQQSIMADDDDYDAAYGLLPYGTSILTDGYLVDLYSIDEMNLDEEWWDKSLNDALVLDGKLYAATSPLQLTALDLSWVLLFNKDMMTEYKVEYPYDLVREGKWTMDAMKECCAAVASLNGDDSFAYKEDGNAIYGIAGHNTAAPYVMLMSSNNDFIQRDDNGGWMYVGPNERTYDCIEKIAQVFNTANGNMVWHCGTNDQITTPGSYYNIFYNDRAAFLTTELKGTKVMRSMKSDYGILPYPKFDEAQEEYITYSSDNCGRLIIPITNNDLSRSGVILDALSYESFYNVLPLYYNQTISQKGLRDEDSIEMLNIINATRKVELGGTFGLTTSLFNGINSLIEGGVTEAASLFATQESVIKANLDALKEAIK